MRNRQIVPLALADYALSLVVTRTQRLHNTGGEFKCLPITNVPFAPAEISSNCSESSAFMGKQHGTIPGFTLAQNSVPRALVGTPIFTIPIAPVSLPLAKIDTPPPEGVLVCSTC
ncbi:hypothetical protein TRVL_10194 [Trypanosoma vivax]|nr:hypothetical protein TRVL_10194 [Trypanosoma vivax]